MKHLFRLTCIALLTLPFTATGQNSNLKQGKKNIEQQEAEGCSEEQNNRKLASIQYCKEHEVPTIPSLPCIEAEAQTKIRSKEEIVNRALALCYLGVKSEGLAQEQLNGFDKRFHIKPHFSPEELKYVNTKEPTQQQMVNANWRYESLHVLLWALGYIDSLEYPSQLCNVAHDVRIIASKTREDFVKGAKPRSEKEILDQADLIYRIHWATVDARVTGQEPPAKLNPSVVYERHYVLNWLINYLDQDWDDISTDT